MGLRALVAAVVLLAGWPRSARAIIDPKFTPVRLVRDAQVILAGLLAPDNQDLRLDRIEVLKGECDPAQRALTFSLADCEKEQSDAVRKLLAEQVNQPAILFASPDEAGWRGYLHAGGSWLEARSADGSQWRLTRLALKMSAVYAGGTDMLVRMSRYILADPQAAAPVAVGVSWMREVAQPGKLAGRIAGMEAVELGPDRRIHLFVACEKGDRLFRAKRNDEAFEDATGPTKLDTRSRRFVWLDLDGDGQAELVSWDGAAVHVRRLGADGGFQPVGPAWKLETTCLALAACSAPDGAAAVLVSTDGPPLLLTWDKQARWRRGELPAGPLVAQMGPAAMACIVADLDNDGHWDVLQPRREGGLLWKGGPKGHAAPVRSAVANPDDSACFALGDFNQDGFLDVFIAGAKTNELWENDGRAGFRPVIRYAGSFAYKSTAGAAACLATDLNHDGRQDLCLLYANGEFAYHFSRGFRCFGEEGELRLATGRPQDAPPGQVACAVADFNGDGSLDLAVGGADGQVYCFYNEAYGRPMARVRLTGRPAGPATVSLWQDKPFPRCLGAISLGTAGKTALLPLGEAGEATIRWALPGQPPKSRTLPPAESQPEQPIDVMVD